MKIYTIRDIAQLSGVSVTTVSRVLNHRPEVNEDTRQRVEKVMADCGFVGNANARGLKQTERNEVYIILRGHQNTFLNQLVERIHSYAADHDALYITVYIDESADEFRTAFRLCQERRPSAIVFVGSAVDKRAEVFREVEIPSIFVTVDTSGTLMKHASSVSIDDRSMGYAVMRYLLEAGHRRIAVLGGSRKGSDVFARRFRGCMDACGEFGLAFDPTWFLTTRFSMTDAMRAIETLYTRHPEMTALFCMSDTLAIGAIRWLTDQGVRVPQDVSVAGFDGLPVGNYLVPRLTTVEQPVDQLAEACVRVLTEMMTQGTSARHVTVPARLLVRESVLPLSNVLRTE